MFPPVSFAFSKSGRSKRAINVDYAKDAFGYELKELLEACTIEQDDAFKVIERYDTPDTFHFIDPPYVGRNMGHYAGMFNEENLHDLLELLTGIQGKFMLTMYPDSLISQYAEMSGWQIHEVERLVAASNPNNTKRRRQSEWMVCNYAPPQGNICTQKKHYFHSYKPSDTYIQIIFTKRYLKIINKKAFFQHLI